MRKKFANISNRIVLCLLALFLIPFSVKAQDTVYVSGGLSHEGLLNWPPVMYNSNSYLDLSVYYLHEAKSFRGLRASTRLELTEWPLPGFTEEFKGHGVSHLSVEADFTWGSITLGDVYGQFGSGMILNLYEDRALGVDGALRGAKIEASPYKGVHLTALGGKQRRYWSCYTDQAWGWNYSQDAAMGIDAEIEIERWSKRMQEKDMSLHIGGSFVSKYEQPDTVYTYVNEQWYRYHFPRWVGAGAVRAEWQMKGVDIMVEYARKANDPTAENRFSYRDGEGLMVSASYSQKGLSVLAQIKRTDNLSFRSDRLKTGISGRLNLMPAFTQQHTYALAAHYPYATQYANGEWAFQTEVRYTWPRKTRMGGRYGTTLKLSASHIRGLASEGSWAINTRPEGEYYTDVNIELNKRLSKKWWLNAMLMYQTCNQTVVEGEGGLIRSGIAVVDARVHVNNNVSMHGEVQYLYSPHFEGQWVMALYELSLYHHVTLSGEWQYNIGGGPAANNEHFYTATVTYTHNAHRLMAGYTKTQEGFNCSGGVCRYIPRQEGVCLSYNFTW